MSRVFNTAGPCRPTKHYMLPPEGRLPGVRRLIDEEHYFVVHAPRQMGKTTYFQALTEALRREGRYTVLLTSCEAGQAAGEDMEVALAALLETVLQDARLQLTPEQRPPEPDPTLSAATRLRDLLIRWSQRSPLPVVLFLDEIDSLVDSALLSVLRQLRSGYGERPRNFPQSVALIGLRDVRDYRVHLRPEISSMGTASPFNIKVESLTLPYFTAPEVAALYLQHTQETGQEITAEAAALAFSLTRGHPWLVNALARQAVEELAPDPGIPITPEIMEQAKEALIKRRDTHLDSLIDRLREPRVQRVIEPILAGELLAPEVLDDDVEFVMDLGLVISDETGLQIANPIYQEVIPRALSAILQRSMTVQPKTFLRPDGGLDFDHLLADFQAFWLGHAESFLARAPYSEAAAQLVFMGYLQKVVNGGGFIEREYAVGSGRVDLCIRWPRPQGIERWAVELKVWRDGRPDPLPKGLDQLAGYLARLQLDEGTLLLFDARATAPPLPQRQAQEEHTVEGRRIAVIRL